jgi:FtsH-binding integral membrane protein
MNPAEFQAANPYAQFGLLAIDAPVDVRKAFIRKTYLHLAAAIYAFVALEFLLFSVDFDQWIMPMLAGSAYSWLIVVGAFMAVSWIADKWARSDTSVGMQYAGLLLYVLAEAVIFVPLLFFAKDAVVNVQGFGDVPIIAAAGVTTLIVFGGLTAFVFLSRKDFSFLGGMLGLSMVGALALIVASALFGLHLGVWFSGLMVIAACGYILFYTSNILHHYRTTQHVAAALALFASVALLFYYILMIFLSNRD